jgi:hypothetical protein
MLEDHVIGSGVLDDHSEAIEILDAAFEVAAIHQPDLDRELLAAREVEEDVLDVRL